MWSSVEDALYNVIAPQISPATTIIAYSNGFENVTPYCFIDMIIDEQVGREETSGALSEDGKLYITEHYIARVRLIFVGKDTDSNHGGNMAKQVMKYLTTPQGLQDLETNGLSLLNKTSIKKVPKLRETSWYDSYVADITVAYQIVDTQTFDSIESVDVTATYVEGNNTITDTIVIP